MANPNCRVLIFSILRFISTKCCKTQINKGGTIVNVVDNVFKIKQKSDPL